MTEPELFHFNAEQFKNYLFYFGCSFNLLFDKLRSLFEWTLKVSFFRGLLGKLIGETVEETNLVRFFGDNPFIRILDAFIDNIGSEYSKKEVQQLAAISKGALFKHWPKLEELGLIAVTRAFGNTKLFTLNRKSPLVKDILRFEARMIEETAPKKVEAIARAR